MGESDAHAPVVHPKKGGKLSSLRVSHRVVCLTRRPCSACGGWVLTVWAAADFECIRCGRLSLYSLVDS